MSHESPDRPVTYLSARVSHRDFTKVSRLSIVLSIATVIIMIAFGFTILIDGSFSLQGGPNEYLLTTRPDPVHIKPWVWYTSLITWALALLSAAIAMVCIGILGCWKVCHFESFGNAKYYDLENSILRGFGLGFIFLCSVASFVLDAEIHRFIVP